MSFSAEELARVAAALEANAVQMNTITCMRHLTVVGLTVLVYESILTYPMERALVWPMPLSVSKMALLFNRYGLPSSFFLTWLSVSGFRGLELNPAGCRALFAVITAFLVVTVTLFNFLILQRAIVCVKSRQWVVRALIAGFIGIYAVVTAVVVRAQTIVLPKLVWDRTIGSCYAVNTTPLLAVGWGLSMVFNLIILGIVCYSAFDGKRSMLPAEGANAALQRDGLVYFISIAFAQLFVLVFVATQDARFTFIPTFFGWALFSIMVNRLLFQLMKLDPLSPRKPRSGLQTMDVPLNIVKSSTEVSSKVTPVSDSDTPKRSLSDSRPTWELAWKAASDAGQIQKPNVMSRVVPHELP